MQEEDSFEQYKKELEQDLGISSIPSPQKPINTYMRYYFQRSSEERSKSQINIKELSSRIAQEWKALPPKKKDFYQQIYQIRLRQYKALLAQFELLSNQRKILSPYSRFIKKRYLQYSKEYKNLSVLQITKLANEDWKGLSLGQKSKLQLQFETEKNDSLLDIDRSDQIKDYLQKLQHYHELLREDKEKVLRKYGLSSQHLAQIKLQNRQKQNEMNKILREERLAFKREQKKKYRDEKKEAQQEERNRVRQIREEQRQKEKQLLKIERLRINAEKEAKRIADRQIRAVRKEIEDMEKQAKKQPKDEPPNVQNQQQAAMPKNNEVKSKKIKKESKNPAKAGSKGTKNKKNSGSKKPIKTKIKRRK